MFNIGLRLGIKLRKAYLLNFILEIVYLPIEFIVFYYIYKAMYRSSAEIGGYVFYQIIIYIFASFILRRIYPISVRAVIERDIHDGTLIIYLTKPFRYVEFLIGRYFATFILLFPISIIIIVLFNLIIVQNITPPQILALYTLASFLGFIVTFELYAITGLASYWMGRHHWLGNLITLSTLIFGGGYIPVSFFPEAIQRILIYSPLQAVYNFPASVISRGYIDTFYFTSTIFWAILLGAIVILMDYYGRKKFESVGG